MPLFLRSLLLLPWLAFGELQDEQSLVQGTLHFSKLREQVVEEVASHQGDAETDEDTDDEVSDAVAGAAAGSVTTATEQENQAAEVAGKAGELDMMARSLTQAKKTLAQARKTAAEARRRVKVLIDENTTAMAKWDRSHKKKEVWASKALSTRLKQKERAGLKGKHAHLDFKAYVDRVKKGNLSSYGLWTTSNEKQHFGEKTWDILSNHIFGLDKLMKVLNNATEYEQNAGKYRAYEKYFSAKAAAAQQEMDELTATIEKAEKDATEARETIASLTAQRTETQAKVRSARKQLAKAKADRKRDNQPEAEQEEEEEEEEEDDMDAEADETEEGQEAEKEEAEPAQAEATEAPEA